MYVSLQDQKLTQLQEHDLGMIKKSQHCTTFMFHLYLFDWKIKVL